MSTWLKDSPGQSFISGNIALSDLSDKIGWHGWRLALAPIALADKPQAQKFLVEILRFLVCALYGCIIIGQPITAGVGGMNLVNQSELAAWTTIASMILNLDETVTKS